MMIEQLESRALFSVTIVLTPGNDTVTIQQGSEIDVWVDRDTTRPPNYRLPAGTPLSINGNGGLDTINLDADMDLTILAGNVVINIGTMEQASPASPLARLAPSLRRLHWRRSFFDHHASS